MRMIPVHRVLFITPDLHIAKIYSDWIHEWVACEVDSIFQTTDSDFSTYDLILFFQNSSDSDLGFLKKLKTENSSASVIVISSAASATIENAVLAMRLGAEDYLASPEEREPGKGEEKEKFQAAVKRALAALGSPISYGLKRLETPDLAFVDDATGLYNTRYLSTVLDAEISKAGLTQNPFAVLFIDLDRFKFFNDKFGHSVGTQLLVEFGEVLSKLVRDTDTVFRYGGDEFVAVLSPCDLSTAKSVSQCIERLVAQTVFLKDPVGLNLRLTLSIGFALFPDHATTKREILDAADQAMYLAKNTRLDLEKERPHRV